MRHGGKRRFGRGGKSYLAARVVGPGGPEDSKNSGVDVLELLQRMCQTS